MTGPEECYSSTRWPAVAGAILHWPFDDAASVWPPSGVRLSDVANLRIGQGVLSPSDVGCRLQGPWAKEEGGPQQISGTDDSTSVVAYLVVTLTLPCDAEPADFLASYVKRRLGASPNMATLTVYDKGTPLAFKWLPGEQMCAQILDPP